VAERVHLRVGRHLRARRALRDVRARCGDGATLRYGGGHSWTTVGQDTLQATVVGGGVHVDDLAAGHVVRQHGTITIIHGIDVIDVHVLGVLVQRRRLLVLVVDLKVRVRQIDHRDDERGYGYGHRVDQIQGVLPVVKVADDQTGVHPGVVAGELHADLGVPLQPDGTIEHGRITAALDIREEPGAHIVVHGAVAHQALV